MWAKCDITVIPTAIEDFYRENKLNVTDCWYYTSTDDIKVKTLIGQSIIRTDVWKKDKQKLYWTLDSSTVKDAA